MAQRTRNSARKLATIPEWERRTGIGQRKLREAVRAGDLPAYYAGSLWPRIFESDLLTWIRTTRVPASDTDAPGADPAQTNPAPTAQTGQDLVPTNDGLGFEEPACADVPVPAEGTARSASGTSQPLDRCVASHSIHQDKESNK